MKPLPTGSYTGLYFSTATIKGWKHLLKPDRYKTIITNSMTFLAEEGSVWFYAFVIMSNHTNRKMNYPSSVAKVEKWLENLPEEIYWRIFTNNNRANV